MRVDPLWAGQYLLVDELWRDKERIIYDPLLCNLLVDPRSEGLWWDKELRVQSLLQSLLAQDKAPVWLLFEQMQAVHAAGLDPSSFGARSVAQSLDIARKGQWAVAMLDLSDYLDQKVSKAEAPIEGHFAQLSALLDSLLSQVDSANDKPRTLLLWCRAEHGDPSRCKRLAVLREWAKPRQSDVPRQLLGLTPAPVLQVFPLGKRQGAGNPSGGEELELEVDNRLGNQHPEFSYYLCVIGAKMPEGITMIELPASAEDSQARDSGHSSGHLSGRMRDDASAATLIPGAWSKATSGSGSGASIPEHLDFAARIEALEEELKVSEQGRLDMLRDLDHATQQIAELEDELDDLRDPAGARLASMSAGSSDLGSKAPGYAGRAQGLASESPAEDGGQIHASAASGPSASMRAAATLQASWELEELRGQVAALRSRPVEELEAENAQLRAMLAERGAPLALDPNAWNVGSSPKTTPATSLANSEETAKAPAGPGDSPASAPAPTGFEEQNTPVGPSLSRPRFFDRYIPWSAAGRPVSFVPSARHPRDLSPEADFKKLSGQLKRLRACLEGGGLLPLALRQELLRLEGDLQRFVQRNG